MLKVQHLQPISQKTGPQQDAKRCSKLLTSSPSYQKKVISNMRSYVQRYSTSTRPTKTKSSTTCESMFKAHHLQPVAEKYIASKMRVAAQSPAPPTHPIKNRPPTICESRFKAQHLHCVPPKIGCQKHAKLCSKILNLELSHKNQVAINMRIDAQSPAPPTCPTKTGPEQYANTNSTRSTSNPSHQK